MSGDRPNTDPPLVEEFVPGQEDIAETFAESDVTVTQTDTEIASESVSLESGVSGFVDVPDPGTTATRNGARGLKINPNAELDTLDVTITSAASGVTRVGVADANGNILHSTTSGVSAGSTTTLDLSSNPLQSGTTYYIGGDAEGNNFTSAYVSTSSYPFTSNAADVTAAGSAVFSSPSDDTTNVFLFSQIDATQPDATSGSVTVEWGYPADVYEWGAAYFDAVLDGETVDVYAEEYDGSTWNEIAGPLSSGDDLPADPSRNVRFRVDFSRASTSNNPRLKEIARREVFKVA
jgi:hypothetical protein